MGEDGSENTSRFSVLCLSFKTVSFSGEISGRGESRSCTMDILTYLPNNQEKDVCVLTLDDEGVPR